MLVLVSAYMSWLRPLVPYQRLRKLVDRTIHLHYKLKPLNPVFDKNWKVLLEAKKELLEAEPPTDHRN
jgi:hypothetical protein